MLPILLYPKLGKNTHFLMSTVMGSFTIQNCLAF